MTNTNNTVLYTGVASNLIKRIYEHKNGTHEGFTKKYKIVKLVYYEIFKDSYNAISREKQIKGGSRKKKNELINDFNIEWTDLYDKL